MIIINKYTGTEATNSDPIRWLGHNGKLAVTADNVSLPTGGTQATATAIMGIATIVMSGDKLSNNTAGYSLRVRQTGRMGADTGTFTFMAGDDTTATNAAISAAIGGRILGSNFNTVSSLDITITDLDNTGTPPSGTRTFAMTLGISSFNITNAGSLYGTSVPTVTIAEAPSGTDHATAIASLSGGTVGLITPTNNGSGYTAIPTVTITAPIGGTISIIWRNGLQTIVVNSQVPLGITNFEAPPGEIYVHYSGSSVAISNLIIDISDQQFQ